MIGGLGGNGMGGRGTCGRLLPAMVLYISLIGLVPSGASGQPFGTPTQYATGPGPGEAAVADLNGDGALDLVTVHPGSSSVSVLLGDGSGAFLPLREYATGTGPLSVQLGDANQDGILDVLTLNSAAVSLLLGNGDGSFGQRTDLATRAGPIGDSSYLLAIADLNADSKLDVIAAGPTLSTFLGNGDGTFAARMDNESFGNFYSLAVGDMNGDSEPDIAYSRSGGIIVLFGNGDGSFRFGRSTPVSLAHFGGEPNIVAVGDLNGDGRMDLGTVVFDVHILAVLLGNGDGSFSGVIEWGSPFASRVLAKGDFNGDGRLDLATSLGGSIAILLGAGDGHVDVQHVYETGGQVGFIAPADLNGDSRLDVAVTLPANNSVAVLLNIRNRAPTANARGPYTGLTNQSIDFSGTGSSDPDGDALAYAWDFGDGNTASGPTPRHTYAAEGVFPVILHVTDTGNLSDDGSTTATVRHDVPVAIILKNDGTVLDAKNGKGHTKLAIEQTMTPYSSILTNTIRLTTDYPTPGIVTECAAEAKAGTGTIGDLNLSAVPDYLISFSESCVRDLFSGAPNNTAATIIVTGEVQISSGTAPLRGVKSVTVRTRTGGATPISTWATPNPFNPETAISYTVRGAGPVTLRIYSIEGRLVRTLKHGEMTSPGTHEVRWDGANDHSQLVSSGIYFVRTDQRLAGAEESSVLKLTLTK